jgi:hypothetical protein
MQFGGGAPIKRSISMIAKTMRAERMFVWLAVACLVSACTTAATAPDRPPPGAVIAQAAHPPIGTKWQVRRTDTTNGSTGEITRTAVPVNYIGTARYGVSDAVNVTVLDPATFNEIATINESDSKELTTTSPDNGAFSWPLWVGKTWQPSYTYQDLGRGRKFGGVTFNHRVIAYEDVTVPAGTFKAFRIDGTPVSSAASFFTYWYAPDVKLVVKLVSRRTSDNYLGAEQTMTELLSRPK